MKPDLTMALTRLTGCDCLRDIPDKLSPDCIRWHGVTGLFPTKQGPLRTPIGLCKSTLALQNTCLRWRGFGMAQTCWRLRWSRQSLCFVRLQRKRVPSKSSFGVTNGPSSPT